MKSVWIGILSLALAGGLATVVTSAPSDKDSTTPTVPSPPGKKVIGAKLKVKADTIEALLEAAKPAIASSRAEAGCISYTLYQDPFDPTVFFFFEEWKDQAAIDFHFSTPHFARFGEQLQDMLEGPPVITIYDAPTQRHPGE